MVSLLGGLLGIGLALLIGALFSLPMSSNRVAARSCSLACASQLA